MDIPGDAELGRMVRRGIRRGEREGAGTRAPDRAVLPPRGRVPLRAPPRRACRALHVPARETPPRLDGGVRRRGRCPGEPQRRCDVAPILLDRCRDDAPPRRLGGPPRGGALPCERGVPGPALHRHAVAARQRPLPRHFPPRRAGPRRGDLDAVSRRPRRPRVRRVSRRLRRHARAARAPSPRPPRGPFLPASPRPRGPLRPGPPPRPRPPDGLQYALLRRPPRLGVRRDLPRGIQSRRGARAPQQHGGLVLVSDGRDRERPRERRRPRPGPRRPDAAPPARAPRPLAAPEEPRPGPPGAVDPRRPLHVPLRGLDRPVRAPGPGSVGAAVLHAGPPADRDPRRVGRRTPRTRGANLPNAGRVPNGGKSVAIAAVLPLPVL